MADGFGIPQSGWFDSIYSKFCSKEFIHLLSEFSVPIWTHMDVEGLPQSGTGQTALFTGINTAKLMGRHLQGFPGPALRDLIKSNNLFKKLIEKGKNVAFANAYIKYSLEELTKFNFRSVTTVMVESTLGWVRNLEHLKKNSAIYHDLTCETISDKINIPKFSADKAAETLAHMSRRYDFTLFEYFLTDRAGHKNELDFLKNTLNDFSSFFCKLMNSVSNQTIVILTGDHGNCEDITTRKHTNNPVPLFVYGYAVPKNLNSIEQIYHFITNEIFKQ